MNVSDKTFNPDFVMPPVPAVGVGGGDGVQGGPNNDDPAKKMDSEEAKGDITEKYVATVKEGKEHYSCNICKYESGQVGSIKKHITMKHKEKSAIDRV